MKLANHTLLPKSPEAGDVLVASILGSTGFLKRENALNSFVKRVTATDVLEGDTQNTEWERAHAEQRPEPPGSSDTQACTLSSRERPGGRPCPGAGARAGRKGRLAGSGDPSQTPGTHCWSRARGSRDILSRRWWGRGGGFVLFLDFAESKEFGKLWEPSC